VSAARAVLRGGYLGSVTGAGVFAFNANFAPSYVSAYNGFRCGRRK
jgi:hypothetical protein